MTELDGGGALRLQRARVIPQSAPPATYSAAVERYLTGAGIAKSSARIYRISLTTWGWMFAGAPAPTGPARRGAKPPLYPIAAIDDPVLPEVLAELAAARADEMDADTDNREPSIARKAIGWWQRQDWIEGDPTIGIERRPALPDRTKALAENQIAALWRLDVALREKTQWKMLYESAARADEVLCLNVEDLYPQDKRGKTTAKGGATARIHWQSGTAQLLPRLIGRRTCGPLFLTDRKAPAGTPTLDVCPDTGRARLSYRRAEEIFDRGEHPAARQPPRLTRGHRGPGRLDAPPAPPQRPDTRRRGRHLHPDAAGPLPPRLRPLPEAVRPPGVKASSRISPAVQSHVPQRATGLSASRDTRDLRVRAHQSLGRGRRPGATWW
ncbi:site-specific recombinase [Streptomyces sp. NPDC006510]|uniref:site-specific recombinase n=1 Tax=Streptomyces sp. NPDC006510 TaxID=3155600 RepID=UPI0033A3FE24